VLVLTVLMTHKIVGPLYRMKKEVEGLHGGDLTRNFNLRADDQLKELAKALGDMEAMLRGKIKNLKEDVNSFSAFMGQHQGPCSPDDKDNVLAKLDHIKKQLEHFRTE
jgi:methyl-accepting chemotaxis protein